jgi:hypothetical protein
MTGLSAEVRAPADRCQHALSPSAGGLLINIDKGGTLTEFGVIDGANVYRTKSVVLSRFHPHERAEVATSMGARALRSTNHGVRLGIAEIYRAVEKIPEVADSLIVPASCPAATSSCRYSLFSRTTHSLTKIFDANSPRSCARNAAHAMFLTQCIMFLTQCMLWRVCRAL